MHNRQFNSAKYWESRYARGGNSGAGSYQELAAYKAGFLNSFVAVRLITSVVEFGCGDGNQLSLAHYPNYIGLDVSETALNMCRERFKGDATKTFSNIERVHRRGVPSPRGELCMSIDVIFHLVEDDVYETYMHRLFRASTRYVIIYSSNHEASEVRNDRLQEATGAPHVRHRKFTDWISKEQPHWRLRTFEPNPFVFDPANPTATSFADFFLYELPPAWRAVRASKTALRRLRGSRISG